MTCCNLRLLLSLAVKLDRWVLISDFLISSYPRFHWLTWTPAERWTTYDLARRIKLSGDSGFTDALAGLAATRRLAIGKGLTSGPFLSHRGRWPRKRARPDLIESLALEYDQPFPLLLCQPIYRVDSPRIWELATISLIAKKVRSKITPMTL
jgi:hypothetical protein